MVHAREDYQRFQDPALDDPSLLGEGGTPVGADEPVMLFRAQDCYFVAVLTAYYGLLCQDFSVGDEMLDAVLGHIELAKEWQANHATKTPDI